MYRKAMEDLSAWKKSPRRKPMALIGARHAGKTWLMKEFARSEYEDSIYISFEDNAAIAKIFDGDKDPKAIVERLGLVREKAILPGKTLVMLDGIQECPNALGSLKCFNEGANEYHVIAAGSMSGVHPAMTVSYPVDNVNILNIYPMTFGEFLSATDTGCTSTLLQSKPARTI